MFLLLTIAHLALQNLYDLVSDLSQFIQFEVTSLIQDDPRIRSKYSVESCIAWLLEAAFLKIIVKDQDSVFVFDYLARYLAQDEIVT